MSSLIINWRFGGWFLQVEPPRNWRHRWGRLSHVPGRPKEGEGLVSIYEGRAYFALAILLVVLAILWLAS